MAAISPSARANPREYPANPKTYREAEIAASLVADAMFFARHPDRRHHARRATSSEVTLVRAVEGRLISPTEGCTAVVLVHRTDDGLRKRVIVEARGFDLDTMNEADIEALWADVTGNGRTSIARGRA